MGKSKNITIRSNKKQDMIDILNKKHKNIIVLDKGVVCDNFGIGGYKYYQRFLVHVI